MSRSEWTDEEAAVQAECWSHGFVLPYEALVDEVVRRREVTAVEAPWPEHPDVDPLDGPPQPERLGDILAREYPDPGPRPSRQGLADHQHWVRIGDHWEVRGTGALVDPETEREHRARRQALIDDEGVPGRPIGPDAEAELGELWVCRHCGDGTDPDDDPKPGLCVMCAEAGRR